MTEINISPSRPFTLTWEGAKGPVEISLLTGTSSDLETVEVIDSGDTRNSYTWTPPDDLPSGTYAFRISDDDDMNYSPQWNYEASDNVPASSPSSTTTPISKSKSTPTPVSTSTPTPTPTSKTTTKPPTTTIITTTAVPATSSKDATSSASDLTTTSSTSLEPTTTAGSSSADVSEPTSSDSISPSPTTVSSVSPSSRPADSSSDPSSSPSAAATETQKPVVGRLSTGTKIGIGVGAGVGGFALLTLAGFLIYRRNKATRMRGAYDGNTFDQDLKPELGGDPRPRVELGGQGLAEMHSNPRIPELWQGHHDEWRRQPSELDATVHYSRGVDVGRV
ncbi:hypothetical protein F5Y12DRAFT_791096 [Xylaria sp. FL1777]|nr:hypothetical protein F5Y12DRAFT_791096 [Xylaria sp. FL1777]